MADVQNTAALGCQFAQGFEQLLDRLRRQHRGRLIQNQQLRLGQQGAHNFHPLAFADRQRMHMALRFQLQAILLGRVRDAPFQLVELGVPRQTERDIFGNGQRIEQRKMLEYHRDTQLSGSGRIGNMDFLAIPEHLAGVRLDRAIDDFHQGRFSGAVFS